MGLPLVTTTLTVERNEGAPLETPSWVDVVANIPAHVGSASGLERLAQGGSAEIVRMRAYVPYGTDVGPGDRVTTGGGAVYHVAWAEPAVGLGLDHLVVGLLEVTGAPAR